MDVAFSHMGIYIGGRQFVHAPSSGKVVSTESLDKDYYFSRFDGARTVFSS
jgi:cell wall-associated NlpC family hydrolase